MKYYFLMIAISIISLATSCNELEDKAENFDSYIDVYMQNSNGDNLLQNKYFEDEIKLYYLENNSLVEVYDANMSTPRNFKFLDVDNNTVLRIFPNANEDEYPITYLEWNELEMDTITCHYMRTEDGLPAKLDTVWYNGERKLPDHFLGPTRGFVIVK